ncbi:MAG: guanylate kinase [Betaproteobacteria bacterium]|jgi:guanylate kinase|nr:guanylate kinase [Pseudomonadota bacterium]NBO04186.1 guanylate kinase [Betaproteobacteria bacterium]HAB47835.1 guanylate kinase [Lautropia sp.]NBO94981.1 guanylate kinase [Betaproteobacteria bacterium]NBP33987.1 guanylate kinase [Betaproteobacteria bacterium]
MTRNAKARIQLVKKDPLDLKYQPLKASLFVIVAPSGAGKTTLVHALLRSRPGIKLSISTTTRAPRRAERQAEHYFFVDEARFLDLIQQGEFLEWAHVHGHYYGTSKAFVQAALAKGDDLLLEIDCQGAAQIKQLFPDAVVVFIAPPSMEELRRRLEARDQDDAQTIARRVEGAQKELLRAHEADFLVINDDFDQALLDLQRIVEASALRYHLRLFRFPQLAERLGLRPPV